MLFSGKTLMITGGTGSFGGAVLDRFLNTDIKEIRIFSRDEKKQDDMRHRYQSDKIKYYIGDVRDYGQREKRHVTAWITSSMRRRSSRCPPASFSPLRR